MRFVPNTFVDISVRLQRLLRARKLDNWRRNSIRALPHARLPAKDAVPAGMVQLRFRSNDMHRPLSAKHRRRRSVRLIRFAQIGCLYVSLGSGIAGVAMI